jgi:iron complex outermembrane receptor protein
LENDSAGYLLAEKLGRDGKNEEKGFMRKSRVATKISRLALMAGASWLVLSSLPAMAQIETVVVTAEKRAEPLQNVPVSVAVVGSQALQRTDINSVSELQVLVPSITFSDSANSRGQGLNVRGIGTQNFSDGVEPSVSTVVDGVVLGRQAMSIFDLVGIDRVEVLRGPQGMLFGKNSSAGVLNIVTRKPDTNGDEFFGSATYSTLNEVKLQGSANLAFSDDAAANLTGYYLNRDGTGKNKFDNSGVNDDGQWALRGRFLYNPTPQLQLLLTADYESIDNTCCVLTPRSASPVYAAVIGPVVASLHNRDANYDSHTFLKQHSGGVSLEADYDLGHDTLTSITAYRGFHDYDNNDGDLSPLPLIDINNATQSQSQFTEELRLQSPGTDRLKYTVGAFFFSQSVDSKTRQSGTLGTPNYLGSNVTRSIDTTSYALFGQATYSITDSFRFIGGLRWTHDKVNSWFERSNVTGAVAGFLGAAPMARTPIKAKDNNLSYKVGAQYDLTKSVMAYATLTTGYKGDAINLLNNLTAAQIASGQAVLDPERAKAYEAGLRTEFWDDRVIANVTGFSTRYKNFQAQSFDATTLNFILSNAGSLRTKGVEADVEVQPADGLSFSANGAYTKAQFVNYTSNCYPGQTVAEGCSGTPARQSLAGATLSNAPKFTYTLNADYDFPVPAIQKVGYLHVSYHHTSNIQDSNNQNPNTIQKAYGLFNASTGIETEDGKYALSVFVKNLFDKHYASVIVANSLFAGSYNQILPEDSRRLVGVSLSGHF